jgi:hypothetical protein
VVTYAKSCRLPIVAYSSKILLDTLTKYGNIYVKEGYKEMPLVNVPNRDGFGYTEYYVNMSDERGESMVVVYDETETVEIWYAVTEDIFSDIEAGFYKWDARDIAKYVHEMVETGQITHGKYLSLS